MSWHSVRRAGELHDTLAKRHVEEEALYHAVEIAGGTVVLEPAVRRLLRAGADAAAHTVEGKTALQWAEEKGHAECVRTFEEHSTTAAEAEGPESFGLFLHENRHLTFFFLHQQRDLVELFVKNL